MMPRLVRLYLCSVARGMVLAALFTGLLIWLDVAHLRHLILASSAGGQAVVMLVIFNGIVFSGTEFAFTIMQMGESSRPQGGLRLHMLAQAVQWLPCRRAGQAVDKDHKARMYR